MMFRGVNKRSALQGLFVINTHPQSFHLTSKTLVRGAVSKNRREDTSEKHFECVSEAFASQKTNVNFLGIESEEGVITINSKTNSEQQNFIKGKLKEKFCRKSFGIIRYDSDNMLNFHGQYGNRNDFSFPHKSDGYSEVSTDGTKVADISDATYNNFKLNPCMKNSETFANETHGNSNVKKQKSSDAYYSSVKDSQEINYIDQYYFNNFSQEEKEDSVQNIIDPPSADELNFLDKNYFGDFAVSKNDKSCPAQDFTKNILSIKACTSDSSKNISVLNNTKSFDENLESDYVEGRNLSSLQNSTTENCLNCSDHILQDALCNQVSSNDISDRRHRDFINSDKCMENKHFDEEIEFVNTQLNVNTTDIKQNLLMRQKHSQFKDNAEICAESDVQFTNNVVTDNCLPKTAKSFITGKGEKHLKVDSKESIDVTDVTTAYDFVKHLKKQQEIPEKNIKTGNDELLDMKLDSKGFRILKNQVNDLSYFTRDEIINLLKQNILYSDDNLLVLNKPYSLVIHDSQTTKSPCLSTFLDELAKEMSQQTVNSKLLTVHRLDKETTGCLLLARNETMAQNLKSLFAQRKIIKKYWILTSSIPDPPEGVIDIPIAEGSIDNRKRMVLNPVIPKHIEYHNHCRGGKQAVTSYKVISESGNAALVEATPITGIKHQIRVHFGFGLSCPILGDHKYSHLDKLAPQKLPSDILQRLHVRQSKVRYIPLHIHAKSITIPGYFEGRNLYVNAPLPNHMSDNLRKLKFKKK